MGALADASRGEDPDRVAGGALPRPAILVALLLAIPVFLVVDALRVSAAVTHDTLSVTVRGASDLSDGALPEIELEGQRFTQVSAAIDQIIDDAAAAGEAPHAQLVAAPNGMSDLELLDADVQRTDVTELLHTDPRGMSFRGALTQETGDAQIEVLVTVRWASADSTTPETAVFFKWSDAVLSQFVPLANQDVELLGTWIAFRRAADASDTTALLVPAELTPDATDYLDDGRQSTNDDFSVLPTDLANQQGAIAFRGVLDHEGALADTLSKVGLSNVLRLDGQVSVSKIDKYICPGFDETSTEQTCQLGKAPRQLTAVGVDLTASIPLAEEDGKNRLPENIYQGADWSLHISANNLGQVSIDLGGSVIVTISDMIVHMRGTIGFTHDPVNGVDEVSFGLAAEEIVDAFGADWLDFDSIGGTITFKSLSETRTKKSPPPTQPPKQTAVFDLELHAAVRLDSIDPAFTDETATATLAFAAGSGGFSIEFTFNTDSELSLNRILAIAGAPESDEFDIGIRDFALAIKFTTDDTSAAPKPKFSDAPDPSDPPIVTWEVPPTTKATVAIKGTTFIGWGASDTEGTRATISTDLFTRFVMNQNGIIDGYFFDVHGSSGVTTTVGQIVGVDLGNLDVELPTFGVSLSDREWSVLAANLDPVTLDYTGGKALGCGTTNAYCIREGLRLNASVDLSTGPLAEALSGTGVVISPDNPLVVSGVLPTGASKEWGLAIQLPTFETPEDVPGVFRSGTLGLAFGQRIPTGGSSGLVETYFEIIGNATVRVPTPGVEYTDQGVDRICPAPTDATTVYPAQCQDDLTFTITAAVEAAPTGVSISLTGKLTTDDGSQNPGWHDPFGVKGLTIRTVVLTVGVTSGTAGVTVDFGMAGAIEIDGDTYNLSFLMGVTPNPPWIRPQGFTFAASSFGLGHLVGLYELVSAQDVDTSNLPDIWLEDVYVAFGLVDNPELCIRTGFLLAAELHYDPAGEPTTGHGSVPACNGNGNLPPASFVDLPQACGDDPTCLAAVLIDVQIGTTLDAILNSKLIAQGYLVPSNLGPLEFDETILLLKLSAQEQQLKIQGGLSIVNPLYDPDNDHESLSYLGTGDFSLDVTISHFLLEAEIQLGGHDGLGAYVSGSATFEDGDGKISFDNPTFDLTVELRTEALDRLAEDIAQGFEDLGTAVEEFGPIVETAVTDTTVDIEQLFIDLGNAIDNVASDIQAELVNAVLETIEDARGWISAINATIEDFNELLALIQADPIALVDADAIIDIVLHGYGPYGFDIRIPGFRWPDGSCFIVPAEGECWTVYTTLTIEFVGVCDPSSTHVICSGLDPADAVAQMATEEFAALAGDAGLDLGEVTAAASASRGYLRSTSASVDTRVYYSTHGVTDEDVLRSLNEEFTGTGVVAGCASTTLRVNAQGGTQTPLDIGLDANGVETNFGSQLNLATGDFAGDGQTFNNGVGQIVQDNLNNVDRVLDCVPPPAQPAPPKVTIALQDGTSSGAHVVTRIDEGGTVWAVGTATDADAVDVDWGDGATSSADVDASDGTWAVSHTYADDGDFDVVATTDDGGSASARLVVENVAPTITTSITTPVSSWSADCGALECGHVDEGDLVTIEVTVADPGDDDHTVFVQWGDGARSASVEVDDGGPVTFTHYYVDGSDPYDDHLLVVTANDHDRRGTSQDRHIIRVHNDAPSVDGFEITAIDDCEDVDCPRGNATDPWVEEGALVEIDIDVHDQGSYDALTLHVDWGDGATTSIPIAPPLTHPRNEAEWLASLTRTVSLQHVYLDDAGDDTTATDYTITAWVADSDGGTSKVGGAVPGDDTFGIEVRNHVPVVLDVVPVMVNGVGVSGADPASFTFDEVDVVEFEVTVLDHGVLDTVTVDVDWGDGDHDWSSGTSQVTLDPPSGGLDDDGVAVDACAVAPWDCDVRTTTFTHHWDDDEGDAETDEAPTASDDYTVTVDATDKDGETSADVTRTVTIDDVVPVVASLTVTPGNPLASVPDGIDAGHVENRSDVTVDLSFVDVSVYDSHVVTIDWGAGWTGGTVDHGTVDTSGADPDIDLRGSTERFTVFTIDAPWTGASTTRTVSLVNRYGDNGDYTITVDVLDDDTLRDNDDSVVLRVTNELPVHSIDRAAAVASGQAFQTVGPPSDDPDLDGVTTWFDEVGSTVVFDDDANDVGSDDLLFDWWTDDHTGTRFQDLATVRWLASISDFGATPVDLAPSPLVDPSQSNMAVGVLDTSGTSGVDYVTSDLTHTWGEACLYGVTVELEDDDGGTPDVDHVPVVIQRARDAGDDSFRNFGQWKNDIDEGIVDQATLDCYLDIAGHLSSVLLGFSEQDGDATPWVEPVGTVDVTERDGLLPMLFTDAPGRGNNKLQTEQSKLDRSLLSALMNLADGAYQWDTQLEAGTPFWQTIAEIEEVRRTSRDAKAISDARKRLWIIGIG